MGRFPPPSYARAPPPLLVSYSLPFSLIGLWPTSSTPSTWGRRRPQGKRTIVPLPPLAECIIFLLLVSCDSHTPPPHPLYGPTRHSLRSRNSHHSSSNSLVTFSSQCTLPTRPIHKSPAFLAVFFLPLTLTGGPLPFHTCFTDLPLIRPECPLSQEGYGPEAS